LFAETAESTLKEEKQHRTVRAYRDQDIQHRDIIFVEIHPLLSSKPNHYVMKYHQNAKEENIIEEKVELFGRYSGKHC
jgi:hypothetical protein